MNPRIKLALTLTMLFAAAQLLAQNSRTLEAQLKAAQHKADIEGDLKGAISQYKKVSDTKGADPALVVKALLGMADSYRKLGDSEAQRVYERLVREFSNQKEAVAKAQARLNALKAERGVNNDLITREFTVRGGGIHAISPDERYVLGNYMHDLTTGTDRRFDLGGADGIVDDARFSKDGKQLAYTWVSLSDEHYELRLINLDSAGIPQGKPLIRLPELGYLMPYDWTPDNKSIVVAMWRDKDSTCEIGLVSAADGSFQTLKNVGSGGPESMFVNPSDSRYIALDLSTNNTRQHRDVYVLARDGNQEPVVVEPTDDIVMGWSPDGKYLIYASEQTSGEVSLHALPFADGKKQGPPKLVKSDIGPNNGLGVTRSGALYYVMVNPSNTRIRIAPFDFETGQIVGSISPRDDFAGLSPIWSPDGKHLAYSKPLAHGGATLIIRSLETGQIVHELEPTLHSWSDARWSPDGRSFLVHGTDFKDQSGKYQINAQTGEVTPLIECDSCALATWSPDGKNIYYVRRGKVRDPQATLVVHDLASGKGADVITGTNISYGASPDGQHIAVTSSGAISIMPANGGQHRELARGSFSAWSPDSRSIAFASAGAVSVISANGGQPRELGRGSFGAWSPDSRSVFVVSQAGEVSLISLEGQVRKISGITDSTPVGIAANPNGRHIAFTTSIGPVSTPGSGTRIGVLENFLPDLDVPTPDFRPVRNFQLTWVDRAGKEIQRVGSPQNYGGAPVLSPDGKRVAITRREPKGADLLIVELGRGTATLLASGVETDLAPLVWSPDSRRVGFVSQRNGKYGLYIKNGDGTGSEEKLLELSYPIFGMVWSPDGKFMGYGVNTPSTSYDLWALPLIGDRKPFPLANTSFGEGYAQFSPDGKWLAFDSNRTGDYKIYVRPFPEGEGEWMLADGRGVWPRWRNDGKELFLYGARDLKAVEVRITGSSVQFGVPETLPLPWDAVTLDGKRFLVLQEVPAAAR